jgi:hypothetical protein
VNVAPVSRGSSAVARVARDSFLFFHPPTPSETSDKANGTLCKGRKRRCAVWPLPQAGPSTALTQEPVCQNATAIEGVGGRKKQKTMTTNTNTQALPVGQQRHMFCNSLDTLCDECLAEHIEWLDERRVADNAREMRAHNIARRRRADRLQLLALKARIRRLLVRSLEKEKKAA